MDPADIGEHRPFGIGRRSYRDVLADAQIMITQPVVLEVLRSQAGNALRELLGGLADHGREAVFAPDVFIGKCVFPDPCFCLLYTSR